MKELHKLGTSIMDNLLNYDKEYQWKLFFNCEVKFDALDYNMHETFNAWILSTRHKTIISMLEEIKDVEKEGVQLQILDVEGNTMCTCLSFNIAYTI